MCCAACPAHCNCTALHCAAHAIHPSESTRCATLHCTVHHCTLLRHLAALFVSVFFPFSRIFLRRPVSTGRRDRSSGSEWTLQFRWRTGAGQGRAAMQSAGGVAVEGRAPARLGSAAGGLSGCAADPPPSAMTVHGGHHSTSQRIARQGNANARPKSLRAMDLQMDARPESLRTLSLPGVGSPSHAC